MGLVKTVVLLFVLGGAVFLGSRCLFGCSKQRQAELEQFFQQARRDGYFGVHSKDAAKHKDSIQVRPFNVAIPDTELEELKRRLVTARYVDHVEDTKFNYGFNSNYLKQVVEYWHTKYNWRKQEAYLNSFPQYKTQIEGIDVHFVRVKPSKPAKKVIPLLVIHGWPGSVLEYYKSFPLLTEPDQNGVAFEVIAPSIPGYGYSEAPHQKGFNSIAAARVFVKLMHRIGHEKFVVHGGDWGSLITRMIGLIYPEHVIGAHILGNFVDKPKSACQAVKFVLAALVPNWFFGSETAAREYSKLFPFGEKFSYIMLESGYMHLQATKPDSVAAALVDSPVGLAAYILEKFSTWTNPAYRDLEDGGLTKKFTLDELLTNIMIYWTSGNIASSQRFYKENFSELFVFMGGAKVTVPSATVDTPYELMRAPRKLIEDSYTNLVQYSEFPRGGHFTAFEEPQLVSADIRKFVHKVLQQQQQQQQQQQSKDSKKKHDEV